MAARGDEARAVSAYVLDRLARECVERGRAAAISRETGIATATITNLPAMQRRGFGGCYSRRRMSRSSCSGASSGQKSTSRISQQYQRFSHAASQRKKIKH